MRPIAHTAPLAPIEEIFVRASRLFCGGGEAARAAVRMSRALGPWIVIQELERERRRSESTGSWGSWQRVQTALRARPDALPPRHRPIYRSAPTRAHRAS